MGNIFTKLFLRVYAANLRRSWRNSQEDAWTDAVFTLDSIVIVPIVSMIMVSWVVATVSLPGSIGKIGMPKAAGLPLIIVVGFVVDYFLSRRFIHYRKSPVARDSLSTMSDSAAIYIAMAISFLFLVASVVTIAILRRGQG
jgi:hypothetical protein